MLKYLKNLLHDSRGATAIEYGLIAALICVAAFASINSLAVKTRGMWNNVAQNVLSSS